MLQQLLLPCIILVLAKATNTTVDDDYYPTWDASDTLDVVDYLLFILSFILIIAGVVIQCCGFDLAGISIVLVGVVCWIAEIGINPNADKLWHSGFSYVMHADACLTQGNVYESVPVA